MQQEECMQPEQLSGVGKKLLGFIEFDKNEVLVDEIRKHPFGLFIIYLTGAVITFAIVFVFVLGPALFREQLAELGLGFSSVETIMIFVGLLLSILATIGTLIGVYLYKNDVILVTSEKIAQVLYKTIFNRKISQLSIGDVQDVTVAQVGIFARIFKYGTIVIETAGEQQNYTFTYVPDPYRRAKLIVGSHENNLTKYGN